MDNSRLVPEPVPIPTPHAAALVSADQRALIAAALSGRGAIRRDRENDRSRMR